MVAQAVVHRGGGYWSKGKEALLQRIHFPPHHRQIHGTGALSPRQILDQIRTGNRLPRYHRQIYGTGARPSRQPLKSICNSVHFVPQLTSTRQSSVFKHSSKLINAGPHVHGAYYGKPIMHNRT